MSDAVPTSSSATTFDRGRAVTKSLLGFVAGAALAMVPAGVGLLWLAVLAGWAWLAIASLTAYRMAPSPVG